MLVDDDWNRFHLENSALSPNEKTAKLREVAEIVAYVNGYDYSQETSKLNRKKNAMRQIFTSAFTKNDRVMYVSTDFEKAAGAFEVHDRNGKHLGEWLFSGRKNSNADDSGGHNIRVK